MSIDKRKDQTYVGSNITDMTGATGSLKSLASGATDYVLTGVNANTGAITVAANVNSDGVITQVVKGQAVLNYDFATDGGAVGTVVLRGDALPKGAVVTDGFLYNHVTGTSGGSATVAINIPVDDVAGLKAATAIATIGVAGPIALIQTGAVANFANITTAVRQPSITIATAALTAMKFTLVLEYTVVKDDTSN